MAILLWTTLCTEAATITKKNNTNNLNTKQSWFGGSAPSLTDIALWDSGSYTNSLGGNVSWLGIQVTIITGPTTISAGNTLTLGASGIDMSAATFGFNLGCNVVLGAAQTWNIASGKTLAASGIISGSNTLTKSGLGTLTLSGVNTYTGATTINAGTLSISAPSGLGSGTAALTINPTGIFQATGTFTASRALVLGGTGGAASGGTIDVTGSNNETRTGVISGTGSLTKTGTGTLTLSAANSFTGDIYINGGTVVAGSSLALGPQPTAGSSLYATHMANGTTLQSLLAFTGGNQQLDLVSGTATLDVVVAATQQRNGLVYGNGGLIKTGPGTLILTNPNTYIGGTTVNGGTLQLNNTTGSGTGTGAVTVNSGGTLSGLPTATGFANAGAISGTVTITSGGILTASSNSTFTFGGLALNTGAISNLQLGAPTNSAVINITGTNAFTLGGVSTINISNAGGLAAGTYHLFDYTGTAITSIVNLQLGSTPGGGFTYSLSNNLTNTSVDLLVSTSNQQWANDANGNWNLLTNWTNAVVPNSVGAQANFFGVINQARTVTVDGAFTVGSLSFNNANAYTIASDGVAGHGLTLSNGGIAQISVAAGSHTISAPLALVDNLDINATTGTALTISGAISENVAGRTLTTSGAGSITFSGANANTYSGLTTVNAGTLNLNKTSGVNAIGAGGVLVGSGGTVALLASNQIADTASLIANGTFSLGTSSETVGGLAGTGSVVAGSGSTLTVGASNNLSSQFDGIISGAGTITKAGTGTLTLTGSNTFGGSGQTVNINGGTLQVASDANFGNTANSLTLNGGTLQTSAGFSTARNLVLTGNGIIDTGNNTDTFSGVISGSGGLTKSGTGTATLSGTNTYTGGTTINAGTVIINSAAGLGNVSGNLALNAGRLEVAGTFTTARNIALGSSASTILVDPSQTYTIGGVVSGSGALNKTGTGGLTLTNANTYTGATVIDGTLIAAATSGSALATTSGVTVNSGGTLLLGASNQLNNAAGVTLDGGTFSKGNFSEGASNSVGMGALTLSATGSHIDFGTGTVGTLSFASFDPGVDLLSITIDNWTGLANTMGTGSTDRLIFDTSTSNANLALFNFTGYASGATQFALGGGFYEVTPITAVPEPATYAAAAIAVLGLAYQQRRRLRRLIRR